MSAKGAALSNGKKLADVVTKIVPRKDHSQFIKPIKLLKEMWTEDEERFLCSTADKIHTFRSDQSTQNQNTPLKPMTPRK